MPSSLVVVRNEKDALLAREVAARTPSVLVVLRLFYTDLDDGAKLFSKNTETVESAVRQALKGLKYDLLRLDCDLTRLPAEAIADEARRRRCSEIVVFQEKFDRDLPYANSLAATLCVVSETPVKVIIV